MSETRQNNTHDRRPINHTELPNQVIGVILSGDGQNDQQDQDDDFNGNTNVHPTDLRFLFDLMGMFRFRLQRRRGNVDVRIQIIQQTGVDFRFLIDR